MLCHFQTHIWSEACLCITSDLQQISFKQFWDDVRAQKVAIEGLAQSHWALWEHDSYDFLVLLFAGLLAQKQIILPPNRVQELVEALEQQHIFFLERQKIRPVAATQPAPAEDLILDEAFLNNAQVYFYTSGSTGQAKKIPRTLKQLLNEVQGLDQSFQLLEQSIVIATVSHQHIYGLLFKLLWPLAHGHAFYTAQLAFPEDVVEHQRRLSTVGFQNYVISSPALLKRWSADVVLVDCAGVYCSGGKLESGVRPNLNATIREIFGSSETGGIAHRAADDALWTPFANVDIKVEAQQQLATRSNHACDTDWIYTGDCAAAIDPHDLKSQFQLKGRMDRIVKLEEKRLSLDAIEHKIQALEQIEQCVVLLTQFEQRQILACVVVLSEAGKREYQQQPKSKFVAELKQLLKLKLEGIAIPRAWRFLSELPLNAQSKLNKPYLASLFHPMDLPVILAQYQTADSAEFKLEFPIELTPFKGHFPDLPIYPGVGQIGFIQSFAKMIWPELQWCDGLEQIKFQDLIRPDAVLQLKLSRKGHKVSFQLLSDTQSLASGRLSFVISD